METNIFERINKDLKNGLSVAMAILTEVKGSSPGKQGAILCMFENGNIMGTVGGGILEHKIICKCKECLENSQDSLFEYNLNKTSKETPMECGGEVKGYIKIFKPKPRLLIVGGGHIGYNVYKISQNLNFYSIIVDDRADYANEERFKDAEEVYSGNIENILKEVHIDKNTYILIATRGYEKDLEALRAVINRENAYIGMIGSNKKWVSIKKELKKESIEEEKLNQVYTPVGINISSNEVEEIALGILSEILMIKNKGDSFHRKYKNLK